MKIALLSLLLFYSLSTFAMTIENDRPGVTVVTLDATDFSTENGELRNDGFLELKQIVTFEKMSANGESYVTDVHHWSIWNYLRGCSCNDQDSRVYCCPSLPPQASKLFAFGKQLDFSGAGILKVYIDIKSHLNYRSHINTGVNSAKISPELLEFELHHSNSKEPLKKYFTLKDFLITPSDPCFSYNDLPCIKSDTEFSNAYFTLIETNPRKVELKIKASKDLVSIFLKNVKMVWVSKIPRQEL